MNKELILELTEVLKDIASQDTKEPLTKLGSWIVSEVTLDVHRKGFLNLYETNETIQNIGFLAESLETESESEDNRRFREGYWKHIKELINGLPDNAYGKEIDKE